MNFYDKVFFMITKDRVEELTKQYYEDIYSFCLALSKNNHEDALDITQEVFLVLTQKHTELDDDKLKHWLLSVAKYKMQEHYRTLKKHEKVYSIEETFTSPDEIFSTMTKFYSYSDADIKMTLDAILKLLTKNDYELYVKRFIENKSQEQIAKELGVPVSTVSTRISRLRKKIQKMGFFAFTVFGQFIIRNFF